jgi:hypothetical protein
LKTDDFLFLKEVLRNRDIHKVRKDNSDHQFPEFGHKEGKIKKKPAKKYISIQWGVVF